MIDNLKECKLIQVYEIIFSISLRLADIVNANLAEMFQTWATRLKQFV